MVHCKRCIFTTFSHECCSAYVELGTMIPKAGAEQAYLSVAYPRPKNLISFLFCWTMLASSRPGAAAADSVIFAQYILFPFYGGTSSDPIVQKVVGVLCITIITIINIFSTKLAIRIHDYVTVFKILTLLVIGGTGFCVATGLWSPVPRADNFSSGFSGATTNAGVLATTLFNVFYAYDGWNNLNYSVADLKDPHKNLPKAAGLGVSLVCFL